MDEWDRDAVYAEIERLGRAMHQLRPSYFDQMSQPAPGAERLITRDGDETGLTHADVISAKVELAEQHGVGFGAVEDMARQAHQQAGLGYSMGEQAKVLKEVMLSLGRGRDQLSDSQILELSRFGGQDEDTVGLAADGLSADARREAAARHLTLPDGSYPVRSVKELHAAAVLAASKHGDYQAARKLIARRAKELGVRLESLPGFGTVAASADTMQLALAMGQYEGGGEAVALAGMTQETSARRSREAGQDSADAVIARHPEFAHLFRAGRTSSRKHPARSGRVIGTKDRAHSSDLDEKAEPPIDVDGEIARYVAMREGEWGGEARHAGSHGSDSYPVKPAGVREREQQRAEGGHGRGGRSIEDLSRGSAQVYGR